MSCNHTTSCQMYPLLAMEPALTLWKNHYCEEQFEKCARYQLSRKGQMVPLTLLPNGKQLAPRSKEAVNAAALFNAIEKGRIHVIHSMMKTGIASMSLHTSDGLSPLMAAASVGNKELVQLMLEHGCDPWKKSSRGLTACDIAREKGHRGCMSILIQAEQNAPPEETFQVGILDSSPTEEEKSSVINFLRKLIPFS